MDSNENEDDDWATIVAESRVKPLDSDDIDKLLAAMFDLSGAVFRLVESINRQSIGDPQYLEANKAASEAARRSLDFLQGVLRKKKMQARKGEANE